MNDYFAALQAHVNGKTLMDVSSSQTSPLVATCGIDNCIFTLDPINNKERTYEFQSNGVDQIYAFALSPDNQHCLIAGNSSLILKLQFSQNSVIVGQNMNDLNTNLSKINQLKYSRSGKMLGICGNDEKTFVYLNTGKLLKCRPGHRESQVIRIQFSYDERFLFTIGTDKKAIIYDLLKDEPLKVKQIFLTQSTDQQFVRSLRGSFHLRNYEIYLPGTKCLKKAMYINDKWEDDEVKQICHDKQISLVKMVEQKTIITSTVEQVYVWNLRYKQKLFLIESFSLKNAYPVNNTFFGVEDDGKLYKYIRAINKQEPMQIQQQQKEEDRVQFEEQESQNQGEIQMSEQHDRQLFVQAKKSKADKMITCAPQIALSTFTNFYQQQRFLLVNNYGCIIEKKINQRQNVIQCQINFDQNKKKILFRDTNIKHVDMNNMFVLFAYQTYQNDKKVQKFGIKVLNSLIVQNWESNWQQIIGVTLGSNWIAISNQSQIKILDLFGHEIRSIGFDRNIIAMRGYQNILAVAFHQTIPIYGSQQISVQLYIVDSPSKFILPNTHLPLTPRTQLKSLIFSREGMLISQDTSGSIKVFSLQTAQWTNIQVIQGIDHRRIWFIGVEQYRIKYWKTSEQDPQPTVAPRFQIKQSTFSLPVIGSYPQGAKQIYQDILWKRFCLDHERARTRLWGGLKFGREHDDSLAHLSNSILSQKQIIQNNTKLDKKTYELVLLYIKQKQGFKALHITKSLIRSIQAMRDLQELFDLEKMRSLAIQLQKFCDIKQKQVQFQQMQTFSFVNLRKIAEQSLKQKSQDPMKRGAKKLPDHMPIFSQNTSQQSQIFENKLHNSQISVNSNIQQNSQLQTDVNPFLKRKSTNQSNQIKKIKQISDHVQKFGIKKKVQQKKGANKFM